MIAFEWSDAAYAALAVFLILCGVAFAYAMVRLGATLGRASSLIHGTEEEALPVIHKLGETLDKVNTELDKVGQMTDSAVDAVDGVDSMVRGVSSVVTTPLQKLSGVAAGARHAASTLKAKGDWREATRVARQEAKRREQELADELRRAGSAGPASDPPKGTPPA